MQFILQRDKQLHFTCSAFASILTVIGLNFFFNLNQNAIWCLAMVIGIAPGIGKEMLDRKKGGSGWSWLDLLADILGAISGGSVALL